MNQIHTVSNTTLAIDGMSCGHCVARVTEVLSAVPGVELRSVAVGSAQLSVIDAGTVGAVIAALAEAGYPARATPEAGASLPENAIKASGCCGGASAVGGKSSCCG